MKNLLNPRWIFVVNTIPTIILFLIYFGEFQVIKTLLPEESTKLWQDFGLTLFILASINIGYAISLIRANKQITYQYGLAAIVTYIPFTYIYGLHVQDIIPFNIPNWMIPSDLSMYVGTFLMPTLIYALVTIVIRLTPENREYQYGAAKNFAAAIGIPILGYVFGMIIAPLWHATESEFETHALIILFIIGTILFLFFFIRAAIFLTLRKQEKWKEYFVTWKVIIAILLPLVGLLLNNTMFGRYSSLSSLMTNDSGIFGNFNGLGFYVFAVINGILVSLPNPESEQKRLWLFLGRVATFAYTLYFFFVFLPYLPLSMLAILAFGLGLLMLVPMVLFIIHINELSHDYKYLTQHFKKRWLVIGAFTAFLIIPTAITIDYKQNKKTLHSALDYVYNPDYEAETRVNKSALRKTINAVKGNKNGRSDIFFSSENQTPFLSMYFNWLVLDNMTLSDVKIRKLNSVFFNERPQSPTINTFGTDGVSVTNISTNSTFDANQNAWRTWVDLEITNHNTATWAREYSTIFDLPTGCWISDYYLYVGDRKEMGILAEKKSALWVYNQITSRRRDPGLLNYLTGNKISFRVFPLAGEEVRRTGIEFIHKEPISLNIDNNIIQLGNEIEQTQNATFENKDLIYLSKKDKSTLAKVERTPYYHFMIDVSEGEEEQKQKNDYNSMINDLIENNSIPTKNVKFTFVDEFSETIEQHLGGQKKLSHHNNQGGFFLDRAMKKELKEVQSQVSTTYPIFVVVSDDYSNAVIENDFADFEMAYPESSDFYYLILNKGLYLSSLNSYTIPKEVATFKERNVVLAYPNRENPIAYLKDDNEGSIILKNNNFDFNNDELQEKEWQTALALHGKRIQHTLNPKLGEQEWIKMIKGSFKSRIMIPETSYIAVENEAQKAALKRKQKQVLSGKKSLDLDQDTRSMSEPTWWIVLISFSLFLWYRKRKVERTTCSSS